MSCEQYRLTLAHTRLRGNTAAVGSAIVSARRRMGSAQAAVSVCSLPTRPGLARGAAYLAQVGQARLALGEGWGGGSLLLREISPPTATPTPNPSPQGGGERTECAATVLRRASRDML